MTSLVVATVRIIRQRKVCKIQLAKRLEKRLREKQATSSGDTATTSSLNLAPVQTTDLRAKFKPAVLRKQWKAFLGKSTVGRNSSFHGLTDEERASIAYVELNCLILIRKVAFFYLFGLQLLGAIALSLYFSINKGDFIRERHTSPVYVITHLCALASLMIFAGGLESFFLPLLSITLGCL